MQGDGTDPLAGLIQHLRAHADQCGQDGSSLYAFLLHRTADDVAAGGPCRSILMERPAERALALAFMGAVHRLVLTGQAPSLAPYYPSVGGSANGSALWPSFLRAVEEHEATVRRLVHRPVQTNEVGRSRALLGGFLVVAKKTALPLRLLEVGASAGLNLRWDRFRYQIGGRTWGDPASPVRLDDGFVGGTPPLDAEVQVAERRGCDLHPLDAASDEDSLTLLSFVWADQPHRFELLRAALHVARRVPAAVDRAEALGWLEQRTAMPVRGVVTVVFHSIVMAYLGQEGRDALPRILAQTGRRADPDAPLAWLRMEPRERGAPEAEVRLTLWPGGGERLLGTSAYHGQRVSWLSSCEPQEQMLELIADG